MFKILCWTSRINFTLNLQFSTLVERWPITWELITKQVVKKQCTLQQLVLLHGLKSFKVQCYQETLLKSINFRLLAVFKILDLIKKKEIRLDISSRFDLNSFNKLALVRSLSNLENYSSALTALCAKQKSCGVTLPFRLSIFDNLRDLSFQMLFKLVLEPVVEIFSDKNSYGFRKNRSPLQALSNVGVHLSSLKNTSINFIFLKGLFSNFSDKSAKWILQRLPIPFKFRVLFLTWFDLKIVNFKDPYLQVCGIPRKLGLLSSLVLNFLLDGMERLLNCSVFSFILKGQFSSYSISSYFFTKSITTRALFLSRFVHKLLIGGYFESTVLHTLTSIFTRFVWKRGLKFVFSSVSLVPGTWIKFSYLGYNFIVKRSNSIKTLTMVQIVKLIPQRSSVRLFCRVLYTIFQTSVHKSSYDLILIINTLLTWWQSYFSLGLSVLECRALTTYLHFLCWRWIQGKHPKGKKNILATYYFGTLYQKQWTFRGFTKNYFSHKKMSLKINYLKLITCLRYNNIFCYYKLPESLRSIPAYSPQAYFVQRYLYNQQLKRVFISRNLEL